MVQKAKELCEDLLANVQEQYEEFKSRPPRNYGGSGGYSDRHGSHSGSYQGYGGYNSPAPGAGNSASPPPGASGTPSTTDYSQYAQYYANAGAGANGQDPYAAYGGYAG